MRKALSKEQYSISKVELKDLMTIFHVVEEKLQTKAPRAMGESFGSLLQQENNILLYRAIILLISIIIKELIIVPAQ
ncbi:MAG TPA: hypothetical protein VFX18_00785 [Candidatus Nitrosocosmicus sp.]|nr:hypothetical protein [Candidatus Nitrosocosmicus sp.]